MQPTMRIPRASTPPSQPSALSFPNCHPRSPDHKYEILIDGAVKSQGDLLLSLEPPLLPPREVPDPTDTKPADWVDQAL